MKDKCNFARIDVDTQAESHRILSIYTRYMLRKYRFEKYNHSIFQICPRYNDYYFHINGLILRSKESIYSKNYNVFYPQSKCHELDILVARFLLRKYKVNIIYDNKVKIKKNVYYKNFRLSFSLVIRDILFEFKEKKTPFKDKQSLDRNTFENPVLIIGHNFSNSAKAYLNLPKKLSKFFSKYNTSTKIILPEYVGLTFKDKLKNLIFIFIQLSLKLRFKISFNLSDIHFIIFRIYYSLYKTKLKKFLLKNKVEKIICSYVNYEYEPVYYAAAREININYFTYDYSIGYPVTNSLYLRYLPDTRKFSDVIFTSCLFRGEQYRNSTKFLEKPPKVLPHTCPQFDFSIKESNYSKKNKSKSKIGIVDNLFSEDCAITYQDINSLLKFLINSRHNLEYILQSKRGYLEKELIKLKEDNKKFISGKKGDFSNLKKADLIISIGWQSIALKAAKAFHKPVLFYSRSKYPYENHFFSSDKIRNKIINNCCQNIWSNESNFSFMLDKILSNTEYYKFIHEETIKLINQIYFYDKKLEYYFSKYLI